MNKLGDWLLNACYLASVTFVTTLVGVILLTWILALTKVCILYLFRVV